MNFPKLTARGLTYLRQQGDVGERAAATILQQREKIKDLTSMLELAERQVRDQALLIGRLQRELAERRTR